ncbi:RNA 2',3'-cyclic phosphodiesterase [Streptomyces sp. NRRL S-87]|uniref:RNA 2',3'-cyclic phosphodiesterase n=1 Tax=Streptomyces sp. NRRL S-87 TaxID=1463920 RepID=UPI0004BF7740|nr:RNA 2',3'-cyclic phosphodiesterase [Streptomyces sp. NRRL S-87]
MRLFVAVLPPPEAVAELARVVDPLARTGRELRWTPHEGWHFTLAFMGDVEEHLLPELHARLARAAERTEAFRLRLHGAGHFSGHALWIGAAGGIDTMRLLADRADAAARRSGIPMEQHRRYTPHLTVARSRNRADMRPYTAELGAFEGAYWQVGDVHLVRSRLPVSGVPGEQPRYETVASWPLTG